MTQSTTTTNRQAVNAHPVCPQWYSIFEVLSSDPDSNKTYMVITNGLGGMHFCTCPAFRYSGGYGEQNCKHIKAVMTWGCFWPKYGDDQICNKNFLNNRDIYIIDSAKKLSTENCPGCGEPMIGTGREV